MFPNESSLRAELAPGWNFPGIGIFYFRVDWKIPKIPKSLESGWGYENLEKILKNLESEIPKIPKSRDRDLDLKVLKKSRVKNPENPGDREFFSGYTRDSGFLMSRDLNLRSPGFFLISGFFYLRNIPRIFFPKNRDFFVRLDVPKKNHRCTTSHCSQSKKYS